jgi:nucleotide-binding universal stress UspA family protein
MEIPMFRHILVPTDGSRLSDVAVQKAIEIAKESDARLTAIHVGTPFHVITINSEALTDTRDAYERHMKEKGREILSAVEKAAEQKGVRCAGRFEVSEQPYEAIINAAAETGCDLIVMASHGRRGVKGLLLGSETQKVLTHSSVPVLVYR